MTVSPGPGPKAEAAVAAPAEAGKKRNRQQFVTTVHPSTLERIEWLCQTLAVPRGQIVDKLVLAMWLQYRTVEDKAPVRYCLTGERCRWNLADVPTVL